MQEGYTIYIIDTETTGLNNIEHDIIEISMSRLIPQMDSSYKEDQKTWYLKPLNPKSISDEALAVNGHLREDILHLTKAGREKYKIPADVINEMEIWMMEDNVSSMDRIFAGQNPYFDVEFLKQLYKKCGISEFPFAVENGNRIIDTKMLVILIDLCTGKRRKHYGLGKLIKAFGVKKDKFHSAEGDVRMTRDLLLKLINTIKPITLESFKDTYVAEEE